MGVETVTVASRLTAVLSCIVSGKAYDASDMTREEYEALFAFSLPHSLEPVVYGELSGSESFALLPEGERDEWRRYALTLAGATVRQEKTLLALLPRLEEDGIACAVAKGIVCRRLYPFPELRFSGDEDVFVRPDDYGRAKARLLSLGYREISDGTFNDPGSSLRLELKGEGFLGEGFRKTEEAMEASFDRLKRVEGTDVMTFPPEISIAYLLCHMAKHFAASGFGIRQVCDLALFCKKYGETADWEYVFGLLDSCGITLFAKNILAICRSELGYETENASFLRGMEGFSPDYGELLRDMSEGGIHGKSSPERVYSVPFVKAAENGSFLRAVFPKYQYMKQKYPSLGKAPFLLPFYWIRRGTGYLFTERNERTSSLRTSADIAEKRKTLMRKYGIG